MCAHLGNHGVLLVLFCAHDLDVLEELFGDPAWNILDALDEAVTI